MARFAKASRRKAEHQALVAAVIRGDELALRTFFELYFPLVQRFALRRLSGDVEAARDVVQSTLTTAVRNLSEFRRESRPFTWLCQIRRGEIFTLIRSRQRRAKYLVLMDDHFGACAVGRRFEEPVAPDQQAFDVAEIARLIRSVLDGLPRQYADVLRWKYMQGCSVRNIGVRLDMSQVAAQSLLAGARAAFRVSVTVGLRRAAWEEMCNVSGEWQ